MYCVYRVCMKEYLPGVGWIDDGCIYSTQQYLVEKERERRIAMAGYQEAGNYHGSKAEIVVVHETFLSSLKTTPVLSTMKGTHPADQGLLSDKKAEIKKIPARRPVRNTNVLSAVL